MRMFLVSLAVTCIAFLSPASAHDYLGDNGEYENYGGWNRPDGKGGCCNTTDCEPIKADQYRVIDGTYYILIDGKWVRVDPKAYLEGTTTSEVAHACWARKWVANIFEKKTRRVNPENPKIHCFKRPGGVGSISPAIVPASFNIRSY